MALGSPTAERGVVKEQNKTHPRFFVHRESARAPDVDGDREFFFELALEGCRRCFSVFHLTPREFPQPTHVAPLGSAGEQDPARIIANDGRNDDHGRGRRINGRHGRHQVYPVAGLLRILGGANLDCLQQNQFGS